MANIEEQNNQGEPIRNHFLKPGEEAIIMEEGVSTRHPIKSVTPSNDTPSIPFQGHSFWQISAPEDTPSETPEDTPSETPKPHKCWCGMEFAKRGYMVRHQQVHTKEKKYACSLCNCKYRRIDNLTAHMKKHERGPEVVRPIRIANVVTVDPLEIDQEDKKTFLCSLCPRRYSSASGLQHHQRSHSNGPLKQFKCDTCDKTFTQSASLRTHLKIHTGERNHQCTLCPWAFLKAMDLKRHMLTHTKEKNHECTHCGKRYRRSDELLNHLWTHSILDGG